MKTDHDVLTLEDGTLFEPKNDSVVECLVHGVKTTYGVLNAIQRLALSEGLDTVESLECIFGHDHVT